MTALPTLREERPFGYWIKRIDRGIEESLGNVLAADGLTRRSWQVFHTIAAGPITPAGLDQAMMPFLSADEPTMLPHADGLAGRGCVSSGADRTLALTPEGVREHRRVAARVQRARGRVTAGLTTEEYATLIDLLQRVATNLDGLVAA